MNDIDHTYWFLSRSAGLVAYLMLFASVTLGLTMTGSLVERWLRRYRVYDIHRFLSLLTLLVVLFHALIVMPDKYLAFSITELLLPFTSPYRPFYMTLGVLGLYLAALIIGTFYLRRLISYTVWRYIHYATFAVFVMALVHAIGAGTDTDAAWVQFVYTLTALVVFNLLVYRVLKGSTRGIRQTRLGRAHDSASTGELLGQG